MKDLWVAFPRDYSPGDVTWGPFDNEDEAREFKQKVGAHVMILPLSETDRYFNLSPNPFR